MPFSPRRTQSNRTMSVLAAVLLLTLGLAAPAEAQDTEVRTYNVTFTGKWNSSSTPGGVAPGAHFTTLIGAVHNSNHTFWAPGGRATAGVEAVAETGSTGRFSSEYNGVANAHKRALIRAGGTGATGTRNFTITVSATHPLVTLLSMIGPSPDWFVGVPGHSLRNGQGGWKTVESINLYAWDAGTEDGAGFSLSNPSTTPQGTITSLRGRGRFSTAPMAELTFTLQAPPPPDDGGDGNTTSPADDGGDTTTSPPDDDGGSDDTTPPTDDDDDDATPPTGGGTYTPPPAPVAVLPALVVTGNDASPVTLSPAFDPDASHYTGFVANRVTAVTLTPMTHDQNARIAIAGKTVASGTAGAPVPLRVGNNPVAITVNAGAATRTYTVTLTRAAAPLATPLTPDRRSLPDLALTLADDTQSSIAARLAAAPRSAALDAGTPTLARLQQALAGVLSGGIWQVPDADVFDPIRAGARVDSGWVAPSVSVNWQALLDDADFVLPLTPAHATDAAPTGLASLSLWSDGAYRNVSGHDDGLNWDGDLLGARLGAELRLTESLTAGSAVGWQRAGWDERNAAGNARHSLSLIGVHPYAGWTHAGMSAWVSGGLGWGQLNSRRNDLTRRTDINTRTLGGGLEGQLLDTADLSVRIKAEGLLTGLETESDTVDAQRLRLALEAGHTRRLTAGAMVTPTLQLGLRHDGGDGQGGLGAELGGALHYTAGPLTLHGRARTLLGRDGYREWGLQGHAEWQSRPDGRGLTFSLTPGYGQAERGIQQLWTQGLRQQATTHARRNYGARLNARLSYGWDARRRGRFTSYLETQWEYAAHYRAGVRWHASEALELHLVSERNGDGGGGEPDNALLLEGRVQF